MTDLHTFTVGQIEMLARWRGIVEAAGMWSPEHHAIHLYGLAGKIMRDEIVHARASKLMQAHEHTDEHPWATGVYEQVLTGMTAEEKVALKERIVASLNNQPKPGRRPVTEA